MEIRNFVFDMGNVILDYNPTRLVNQLFEKPEERDLIMREVFGASGWLELDKGVISYADHLAELSLRFPHHAQKISWLLDHWHTDQPLVPGTFELVQKIKSLGYKLYVLSNASLRFYTYAPNYEIFDLFDGITISADVKVLKPHPEIYQFFVQIHALKPEECFFIDDKQDNIDAAIALGWQGCVFHNAEQIEQYLFQEFDI